MDTQYYISKKILKKLPVYFAVVFSDDLVMESVWLVKGFGFRYNSTTVKKMSVAIKNCKKVAPKKFLNLLSKKNAELSANIEKLVLNDKGTGGK